jgi:drug/metabolite transporter (DMT)-like permease
VVAFLLYNWALRSVSTALAGTSLTLIPVFGLAFSVVFLGDPVSLRTLVAALAVVAGLLVTQNAERTRPPTSAERDLEPLSG